MKQVCHRDLKLENTLLDGSPAPRLKICDFGYSKVSIFVFSLFQFFSFKAIRMNLNVPMDNGMTNKTEERKRKFDSVFRIVLVFVYLHHISNC